MSTIIRVLVVFDALAIVFCLPVIIALYVSYFAAVRKARCLRRLRSSTTRIPITEVRESRLTPWSLPDPPLGPTPDWMLDQPRA